MAGALLNNALNKISQMPGSWSISSNPKRFLFFKSLIAGLLSFGPLQAQPPLEDHQYLGVRGSYTYFEEQPNFYGVGPAFRVNITNRLALNYHLQFGADSRNKFHVHSYLGGATAFYLFAKGLSEPKNRELNYLGSLLALFVPEGLSYNAKLGDHLYLEPTLNPLGFHIASEQDLSAEVGMRLRFRLGKINITPFLGSEVLYRKAVPVGFTNGLSITYRISE